MTSYFIRRFLLIIPTFLGITLSVFVIMHFVPGGPVERQIMRYKMALATEGGAAAEESPFGEAEPGLVPAPEPEGAGDDPFQEVPVPAESTEEPAP